VLQIRIFDGDRESKLDLCIICVVQVRPEGAGIAVGIATGFGLDNRGVGVRVKNYLFCTASRPALGPTQPPIQWVPGDL
jgi:hypothetical protein